MKSVVIDASVIVKWVLPDQSEEDHITQAVTLLEAIKQGAIKVLQPPHWLAEVAAVIVRIRPEIAIETIDLLDAMHFSLEEDPQIYHLACQLSKRFNHHLFDTLYHAVALYNRNTCFVTADEQYYKKAFKQGAIARLTEFSVFSKVPVSSISV